MKGFIKEPDILFNQNHFLKGMTSPLRNGACWGISIRWLQECIRKGPAFASHILQKGFPPLEAIINHDRHANEFVACSNMNPEDQICAVSFALSAQRFPLETEPCIISSTGGHYNIAASTINAIHKINEKNSFYLMIIQCGARFRWDRHAIAIAKVGAFWAIFDPNLGTWILIGRKEQPPRNFLRLLVDHFRYYQAKKVLFFSKKPLAPVYKCPY